MKDNKEATPISNTGATIELVTTRGSTSALCAPAEECRPLCEPCTDAGLECAPDCTCAPCEEQGKEHLSDEDQPIIGEDQSCEPNN